MGGDSYICHVCYLNLTFYFKDSRSYYEAVKYVGL